MDSCISVNEFIEIPDRLTPRAVSYICTIEGGTYKVTYLRTGDATNGLCRYRLECIQCIVPPLRGIKDYLDTRRVPEPVLADEIAAREQEWLS